jgi:hypothetical protein
VVGSPRSPRVWPPASGHPAGRGVAAEGREAAEVRAAGERDEWWLDSFAVFGLLGGPGSAGCGGGSGTETTQPACFAGAVSPV